MITKEWIKIVASCFYLLALVSGLYYFEEWLSSDNEDEVNTDKHAQYAPKTLEEAGIIP